MMKHIEEPFDETTSTDTHSKDQSEDSAALLVKLETLLFRPTA